MDNKQEIKKILAELKKQGYNRERIEKEIQPPYKRGSIGQVLSRGGNPTMLTRLTEFYNDIMAKSENPAFEVLNLVKEMKVDIDIMFSAMVELVAKNTGQSVTVVREQFQKIRNEKLGKKTNK